MRYEDRPDIVNRPMVKEAIERRKRNEPLGRDDFSELELFHIELECRRRDPGFDPFLFTKFWNELRPKLLAPAGEDKTPDLIKAWAQPEAEELFEKWWDREIRDRDAQSYEAAKALLLIAGSMSQNLREAHDDLQEKPRLREHFTRLVKLTARFKRQPQVPPMLVGDYSAMTRLLGRLGRKFPMIAMEQNIKIVRQLAEMFPDYGIGREVAIDGTLIPYWCPQRSAKVNGVLNEALERRFNRGYERIGFKAIGYDEDGQYNDSDPKKKRKKKPKSCRGGLFVMLVDRASGLPLVAVLVAANTHEAHTLYELLPTLYALWPEIPLESIVADKLYDDRELHRFCEVNYGVHLTAIRRPSLATSTGKLFNEKQSARIKSIDGSGVARCRAHDKQLMIEAIETPNRKALGLLPGEKAPESDFRVRYTDKGQCGCGRPTLKMEVDWSQLSYNPRNGFSLLTRDDPGSLPVLKRYNRRLALEAIGRNQSEAAFSSLKSGYGLGSLGSRRIRVGDDYVYETLIWAALITRSLKMLACEREHLNAASAGATTIKKSKKVA